MANQSSKTTARRANASAAKLVVGRQSLPVENRVTLRTVADHLGLSPTTVSRALKRGDDVNADTIAKVEAAARALGYRPHLGGINLRTGRTHTVGIILPLGGEGDVNKFVASLIEGVSSFLKSVGYRTAVVPLLASDDPIDVLKDLVNENSVDGIILTNTTPQDERVRYLLQAKIPFITFGRTELFSPHAYVDVDHEMVGASAAATLFDSGHERLVMIAPPQELTYSLQFQRGWSRTFWERGAALDPSSIVYSANASNSGREIAARLMNERPDTTAAFIAHDDTAMGFIAGLLPFGRRVGSDFGIITYGGTRMHSFINPPLSAFTFPHFRTGQSLARLLIELLKGGNAGQLHEVSLAEFIDLGSHCRRVQSR